MFSSWVSRALSSHLVQFLGTHRNESSISEIVGGEVVISTPAVDNSEDMANALGMVKKISMFLNPLVSLYLI